VHQAALHGALLHASLLPYPTATDYTPPAGQHRGKGAG
jgi:hypothetical protein